MFRKIVSFLWPVLKNKYYLTLILFAVWISFFDSNNLYEVYKLRREYQNMENQKNFYTRETAIVNAEKEELFSNEKNLEKFARERYFMKRDDEDIYIFEDKK